MELNRHFLGGMEAIVLDRNKKDWPASAEFHAADHVEAIVRLAKAWGVGFFNDKPVRHFWLSTRALPFLAYQKVPGRENCWLVLSGNRARIHLALTRLLDQNRTEKPESLTLRVDPPYRSGTMALVEDGPRYRIATSMASFPNLNVREMITVKGSVRCETESIPFVFEDIKVPEEDPVWNEALPNVTPREYPDQEFF
jgi:hypothetical protein